MSILPLLHLGITAVNILCQICGHPVYIFFEVCSTCNDLRLGRCIWHMYEIDRDLCNVSVHKTVIIPHETFASLRKRSTEIREVAKDKEPVTEGSVTWRKIDGAGERPDRPARRLGRKERSWTPREKKRESKRAEGGEVA